MTKKKTQPEPTNLHDIVAHARATVAIQNMTNMKLQVNNNKIVSFGPHKGEWRLYKNYIIAPHQCITTVLLEHETHQLMVYSDPQPELFMYMISDVDLYDKITIQLHKDHYKFVDGLACSPSSREPHVHPGETS
jgi:hypothetical protein